MKYYISATPGAMPPAPELFDAAMDWLDAKISDGTFDCIFSFMEGGGFCIANADSHRGAFDLMTEYPLFGMVDWDVRPLLEFRDGIEIVRAKLVQAQAALAGH